MMTKKESLLHGIFMMKRYIVLFISLTYMHNAESISSRKCNLTLEPLWQEIQDTQERTITFNGKWIRAGTIIFRKKIIGPIELHTITLDWHGPHIDTLAASLYCTEINKPFLAIDSNWISDGQWSTQSQRLTFKFQSPCTLCAITTFHLMLTVPTGLEPILKQGYFTLSTCNLPQEYQDIQEEARRLSFHTLPSSCLS